MTAAPMRLLTNAGDVVRALASDGPQTPADLALRLSIPRSSAYRLVDGLVSTGLIEVLPDTRVHLTSRWLHLSDAARSAMSEWEAAASQLTAINAESGLTAYLSVLRGDLAFCIDWRPGRGIEVMALRPGRSLPLHAGAAGRLLLAHLDDPERVLRRAPFAARTNRTLTERDQLLDDIARTRREGWVLSDEDVTPAISAIGVAIGGPGEGTGCLSLAGPSSEIHSRLPRLLESLHGAVSAFAAAA